MQALQGTRAVSKTVSQGRTSLHLRLTQRLDGANSLIFLYNPSKHSNFISLQGSSRAFSSSFEHGFQASSQSASNPRWLNRTRQTKTPSDMKKTSHQTHEVIEADGAAKKDEVLLKDSQDEPPAGSSAGSSSSAPPSSDGNDDSSSQPPPSSPSDGSAPPESSAISKVSVPEVYPRLLALPIARRPLFPGFYKAVVVRDPAVVAAMKDMLARGQPYLGAFLLKAGEGDSDTITDLDTVHKVGVFAQITSVFPASGSKDDKDGSLTVVLYPHRRIKITELVPKQGEEGVSTIQVEDAGSEAGPTVAEGQSEIVTNPCKCYHAFSRAILTRRSPPTNTISTRPCRVFGQRREFSSATIRQEQSLHSRSHV
jgi:Lon-like ATP-dependent protease